MCPVGEAAMSEGRFACGSCGNTVSDGFSEHRLGFIQRELIHWRFSQVFSYLFHFRLMLISAPLVEV